jgi:hypothetical protein
MDRAKHPDHDAAANKVTRLTRAADHVCVYRNAHLPERQERTGMMNRILALQGLSASSIGMEYAAAYSTDSNQCSSETTACSTQSNSCGSDMNLAW